MADNMGIAAQIGANPPQQTNPLQLLTGLEQFRKLQQENEMLGMQVHQKGIDVRSLANYGQSGNLVDLRRASPEMYESAARGATTDFNLGAEHRARKAYEILNTKDPAEKKRLWNEAGEDWTKRGWMTQKDWDQHKDKPSDLVLQGVIRNSMDIQKHMAMTGATAGAEAGARAPYEHVVTEPTQQISYPGMRPGAPLAPGVGSVPSAAAPAPGAAPPPPVPGPAQPAARPQSDIDKFNAADPYYQSAPSRPVAPTVPGGPGVVQGGVHPLAAQAAQAGLKHAEELSQKADMAARDQAELNSLRANLDSGKAKTGMFTEAKMYVAAAIYGATGDARLAGNLTGVNLPALEVFAKDATRRGLTFARQTEGAREAVMAIQIALRANPGLLNTVEGNKKMIDILEAGDKYDQEMSRAAQSYMMKQQDTTGTGHLIGFQDWFIKQHHPGQTVSKAVPYPVPRDPAEWQDGYTYEFPIGGKDRYGQPITGVGTWNAKTRHFDPVTK